MSEPTGVPPPGDEAPLGLSLDGFRAVFRIPNFRRLFWGQAISALGDWAGTLAFIAAAADLAPGRPFAITGILVIRLFPTLFATPIGGVLSDRFDRKRIMITSDLVRLGVIMLAAFIPNLPALYGLAFVHEAFSLVFLPARDASLPNIIPPERLEAANALVMGSSFGGIPLSGPVYGGLAWIAAHFPTSLPTEHRWRAHPWAFAFAFDALTFLASAWAINRMALPRGPASDDAKQERFMTSLRQGVAFVRGSSTLRGLSYAVGLGMLGGGVLFAVGIKYVKDTLGGNDVAFGWLMGIFGGGMVLGFVASQIRFGRGFAWVLRANLLAMSGVLIVMAVIPQLWMAYIMASVFGLTFSISIILAMTQAQLLTEDAMRGRVMAMVQILVRAALLIGAVAAAGVSQIFDKGLRVPIIGYHADPNQVAMTIAGGLIAAGVIGVRGIKPA